MNTPSGTGTGAKVRRMCEFLWASPTQLGMCEFGGGMEVPMVQFLLDGTNRE